MALRTFVKNQRNHQSDRVARYCSGMYVDLLGLPSREGADRQVSVTTFKENFEVGFQGVDFVRKLKWAKACREPKTLSGLAARSSGWKP